MSQESSPQIAKDIRLKLKNPRKGLPTSSMGLGRLCRIQRFVEGLT
jgi:hypothetical protein